jgi:ketosteroid isomerase-like protein
MNALEVTQASFDAWNSHDADAILALYADGGTYSAPRSGNDLTGKAIANYAKALSTAYPDFSIEIISIGDTGGGLVATFAGRPSL